MKQRDSKADTGNNPEPFELQNLPPSSQGDDAVYISQDTDFNPFQLIEDDTPSRSSAKDPSEYYDFLEKSAKDPQLTNSALSRTSRAFMTWMRDFEVRNPESAGAKYAILAAVLLTQSCATKIVAYPHISFISYAYLQCLMVLLVTYLLCRVFNVKPFLELEARQQSLKTSAFLYLIGGLCYIYSWSLWPRKYSHFLLATLPLLALVREITSLKQRIKTTEFVFFAMNLVGMFVLLAIPDTEEDFSFLGLGLSCFAVLLIFAGYVKMDHGRGNLISMNFVYSFVAGIFLPAFFALQEGGSPSFFEVLQIFVLGLFPAVGVLLAVRSTQISKSSHVLLFASLGLACINFGRGVETDGFTIEAVVGTVLGFIGAILILINQDTKTQRMDYSKTVPLIS